MNGQPAPSLLERLLAGTFFASAALLCYAVWGFFNDRRVTFLDNDSLFKYFAGFAFLLGFVIGISRTAELVFKLLFPRLQPQFPMWQRLLFALVFGGGLYLALEYL